MREYELMILCDDAISEETYKGYQEKWEKVLLGGDTAHLIQKLDWGVRTLATPIGHKRQARYMVYLFASTPEKIAEFEKSIRYDRNVLRHLILQKADTVDVEKRKKEIAENAKKEMMEKEQKHKSEELSADAIAERKKAATEDATKS